MITGTHVLLYSKDPEADRAFFRDILKFRSVDAGGGWLIFALPPAELGVHPSMDNFVQTHAEHSLLGAVLYLMCDDLDEAIKKLKSRNVSCTEIETAEWGITTSVKLPSGGEIGLYQPTHPTVIDSAQRKT
jgi:catechol 2,3-dioxygenase-like lactoylglutathione lyase family enzyme